jgi:hypothetical protein
MACPACGCKVHYQFNSEDDFAGDDERLERCAACGAVFDLEDAADDEDDYYSEEAADIAESKKRSAAASIGKSQSNGRS